MHRQLIHKNRIRILFADIWFDLITLSELFFLEAVEAEVEEDSSLLLEDLILLFLLSLSLSLSFGSYDMVS